MDKENLNQNIEKAILSTIVYFDIFNYPLTETEIYKWLYSGTGSNLEKITILDIKNQLETNSNLKNKIGYQQGFYFLKDREELIGRRRKNHIIALKRWKKLRKICSLIKIIPFVKMIAACNTMAIHDIKPTSDIDVFIIVKSGRIWITRFLITSLVGLMGQWRHKDSIANKICLSFYTTDDNLNFESLAKKPYDIYLMYWIALVVPLLDRGSYHKFMNENNWIRKYLPNLYNFKPIIYERKVSIGGFSDLINKMFERILSRRLGDIIEKNIRKIQKNKMEKNYFSVAKKNDTDVIISDQMLKFHEVDKRVEFREKFEKKLKEVIS